jgi:hypothetical protein
MENPVDMGGIAHMTHLQLKIDIFFNSIDSQGQGRAVREMIDDGVYAGQIYGWCKQFHSRDLFRKTETGDTAYRKIHTN